MMKNVRILLTLIAVGILHSFSTASADEPKTVEDLFSYAHRTQLALEIEAAIALAQSKEGVIPADAAAEIERKADIQYAPLDEIDEEYARVRHRMVALLNVWKRNLDGDAADYVHYGVTTVDIYDTVKVLQIRETILRLISDMRETELLLLDLAETHKDTPMIGRTLGQHALPITFGKKVSVWAAMNRRNIERLKEVLARVEQLGVLKGAVGTHLGLGPNAIEIEERVSKQLGLERPDPTDWHGARDVFAEYAQTLALVAKSYAAMGGEIFRLQMTDIGEVHERRVRTAVSSSTMPHKRNPSRSEALIHHGRTIPRLAEVLLDDVENAFERDNTSRPNQVIESISIEASKMINDAKTLISRLEVHPDQMRENLYQTDGMVTAQRIVLFLADAIGREDAETRVKAAAVLAIESDDISFRNALLNDAVLRPLLSEELDSLLSPERYLGLSSIQVERTVAKVQAHRRSDPILE